MNEGLETHDGQEPRRKQRQAAYKAWRTIKRKDRERAASSARRIDEFVSPAKIASIRHPEQTEPAGKTRHYGRGVICQFSKTPERIVCGQFWELRWAFGCPLNCAYCYLRGTSRGNMQPRYVKLETVLKALDEVFKDSQFNDGKPALFNSGELCDSLMKPEHMETIADKFEEQDQHRLVLVTKLGLPNAAFLLKKPRHNTVAIWSINAPEVSGRWETAAPPPKERIRAAAMVSEAGYDVRIRIDPIFPMDHWKVDYTSLAHQILSSFTPHRIILGTPRGLWKTLHYARKADVDVTWTQYFASEETGWGMKLPLGQRVEIYRFMYSALAKHGFTRSRISVCKETEQFYEALNVQYSRSTCQCYNG